MTDLEPSVEIYKVVFEMDQLGEAHFDNPQFDEYLIANADQSQIMVILSTEVWPVADTPGFIGVVRTDDLDGAYRRVLECGGRIAKDMTDVGEFRLFFAEDPPGYLIEIVDIAQPAVGTGPERLDLGGSVL